MKTDKYKENDNITKKNKSNIGMSGLRSDQNIKLRMLTHRLPQQEDGLGLVVGPQAVVARPSAARIDGDKRGGKKVGQI